MRKVPHKPPCYRTGAGWYTDGGIDVLNFMTDVGFDVLNFMTDVGDVKHVLFSLIFTMLWPKQGSIHLLSESAKSEAVSQVLSGGAAAH